MKRKIYKVLSREIAIEYKACLYFSCMVAFSCMYQLYHNSSRVSIWHLFQIILAAYLTGYLQVYVMDNFDEADKFGGREAAAAFVCTCIYTVFSLVFGWFGRALLASVLFFGYVYLVYLCVYLCNKVKRRIDTKNLNDLLLEYKTNEDFS